VSSGFEGEVSADQLMQDENPRTPVVPVQIVGPVDVRELPSKAAAPRSVMAYAATATKVLSADARRKRATIMSFEQEIVFGSSQASATARWPKLIPLYWDSRGELWIKSNQAGSDTELTVLVEAWAQ
jgi:hypothetical protein